MNKQKEIEALKKKRKTYLALADELNTKIIKLQNATSITTPKLLEEISSVYELTNFVTKGFKIRIYQGKYDYILGGDGRIRPWSEPREGTICDITTKYYLEGGQRMLVNQYLKTLGNIDQINYTL